MTTTAIATQQPQRERGITLQHVIDMTGFSMADIALVRSSVAKGATLEELGVFLHSARQLGLDPLARQIYWIKRDANAPGTLQVGIDGFRLIAARTKEYAGSEDASFRGTIEIDGEGRKISVPEVATVTVWRIVAGRKCAFVGSARWTEFYPGPSKAGFMYRKMPYHMLGKDAEAQALRKGFAAEMTGMPTTAAEHLIQVTEEPPEERSDPERTKALAARRDEIFGTEEEWDTAADPVPGSRAAAMANPAELDRQVQNEADRYNREQAEQSAKPNIAAWQENRQLAKRAQELGLTGVPVLNNRTAVDVVAEANRILRERIENAELDRQLGAEQQTEAPL